MNSPERSRKIPVTEREFLWVQDDDKGEVILHVGPTMVSPTAADRVVVDDGKGGFRESKTGTPQKMIEVGDNQYAVLFNPIIEEERVKDKDHRNGSFRPGRNEPRPLDNGTRQMIPGPCSFYLRPGQRCEVRDAHKLNSDQYLVVEVYNKVDSDAPYYKTTLKSAEITTFTADDGTEEEKSKSKSKLENSLVPDDDSEEKLPRPVELKGDNLTRGQLIVIRGLDTQFYIPPTGVDIVPDTSADASGSALSGEKAKEILSQALESCQDEYGPLGDIYDDQRLGSFEAVADANIAESLPSASAKSKKRGASRSSETPVEQAAMRRHRVQKEAAQYANLVSNIQNSPQLQYELQRQAGQTRLVRQAVVLREKEFCVVIDADGRRNIKIGPARVFPGPYDHFQVEGSRNRVYDAFELLPQRALWLRVVKEISKNELQSKLPRDFNLQKEKYYPGDEIFLTSVSGFFFPFNEIEVLTPESGLAFVGNDHSKVFVEAIGIDQKSGIYVRDLETGEAKLVRGKRAYLVHPAKEVHISRTIPAEDWNHWVVPGEPHKTSRQPIVTPWALSIVVPHGTACLATSAKGQRVVEGPCVELLEYEESLAALKLSTGTPKTDDHLIKTCFLRTVGNRVSDVIRIETSDFVNIDVEVRFSVTFEQEHKEEWFNHENYIQVLVEHIRSLVRNRCRSMKLSDLWPIIPDVLRDGILGEKNAENGERPGRFFEENGMRITEVEVLKSKILDTEIAAQFDAVQREIVQLQIGDHHAKAKLASAKLRAEVEKAQFSLDRENEEMRSTLSALKRELAQKADLDVIEKRATKDQMEQVRSSECAMASLKAKLERLEVEREKDRENKGKQAEADASALRVISEAELEKEEALNKLKQALLAAEAEADVQRNKAVQPQLVEAITALGDKELLAKAAENMNLVSLVKGQEAASLLGDMFKGTRIVNTLKQMGKRVVGDMTPAKTAK
jgi:major vault protein